MKKLYKKIIACAAILFCLLCVSCASSKTESVQETNTTFINAYPESAGQVYSVRIFKKLTRVALVDAQNREVVTELSEDAYTYDSKTGLLTVSAYAEDTDQDAVFHIEGVPVAPAVFVLNGFTDGKNHMCVFINEKQASFGTDYTFDSKTGTVNFPASVAIDDVPYLIVWTTEDGILINSCSDNILGQEDVYDALVKQWYVETVIGRART